MKALGLLLSFTVVFLSTNSFSSSPIKVAVIDTGLDLNDPRFSPLICPGESKDFTGTTLRDTVGHGTHVAGLIKQEAGESGYCLMILKYWTPGETGQESLHRLSAAIQYAIAHGARFVNYSGGGPEFDEQEYLSIRNAPETTFVVAAGNDGEDLSRAPSKYYPASYELKNIIPVGASQNCSPGEACCTHLASSNYGLPGMVWEIGENVYSTLPGGISGFMSGTSMSTAIHTGKLIERQVPHVAWAF